MVSDIMQRVTESLQAHSASYITALLQVPPDQSAEQPQLLGTGFFIEGLEDGVLITAGHVVRASSDRSQIGFSRDNGANAVRPGREWLVANPPADLAGAALWRGALTGRPKALLSRSRLATHFEGVENDLLYVHGFPGASAFNLSQGTAVKSHGLATTLSEDQSEEFSPRFAIRYSQEGAQKSTGAPATSPNPHGMSGSPVWRANWNGDISNWCPDMASVIGVAVMWSQEFPVLIVEPASRLAHFLEEL